jgi:hypothetical protein
VRSKDYRKIFMVSLSLTGPGLEGSKGTWATNKLTSYGSFFAVDHFAQEFSDWGPSPIRAASTMEWPSLRSAWARSPGRLLPKLSPLAIGKAINHREITARKRPYVSTTATRFGIESEALRPVPLLTAPPL